MKTQYLPLVVAAALMGVAVTSTVTVMAAAHAAPKVVAVDQSVANGIVSAKEIVAGENGWMVVHRVKADGKPGPVVGHAPLRAGVNEDVAAILTGPVAVGDKLMLMIHSEQGGMLTGIFEYSLGAKEDGPIKPNGQLVMAVITTK